LDVEHVGVWDLRPVGDVGTHRRQRVAHLAGTPLTCVELEVAGARVVDDRVAVDVVERPLFRHEARRLPDDHAELHLPVEGFLPARAENRLAWIEDGVGPFGEYRRLLGYAAARLRRLAPV